MSNQLSREEKVQYPHLAWRKTGKQSGKWYYRHVVPVGLRKILGRREIVKSLKTDSKAKAKIRYLQVALASEETIRDALQGTPTTSEYDNLRRQRVADYSKAKRDSHKFYTETASTLLFVEDKNGNPDPLAESLHRHNFNIQLRGICNLAEFHLETTVTTTVQLR